MAYVGGNDGMLHAFKFGKLQQTWTGQGTDDKAQLANLDTSTDLGTEAWSFIPKNALPYLKYMMDTNYCHLNYIDLPPLLVDASVPTGTGADTATATKTVNSWKTILIGGMGLGGASRNSSDSSCTTGASGSCVKTPTADIGFSSYFAINVTDPANPQLLWEFSNSSLGFSTSGPAIVRIGDPDKNGKWFAVFASGPTGPIDTTNHQFLGQSNQNMKIFVVDLYTGSTTTIDTGIANAFSGSLRNAAIDVNKGSTYTTGRYSDDVLYLGYTQKDTTVSPATWTKGGVVRVVTKENPDPTTWTVSTVVSGIGPVTRRVTRAQDRINKALWLYFGTGRFFYRYDGVMDDALGKRAIYGLREPCYTLSNTIDTSCTSSVATSSMTNQSGTTPSSSLSSGSMGWYINLDAAAQSDGTEATTEAAVVKGAERVITDPVALFSGVVLFTTYVPSVDVCSLGGSSYIWAVRYNAGDAPGAALGGGSLISQVSTGVIAQVSLSSSSFTAAGGRKYMGPASGSPADSGVGGGGKNSEEGPTPSVKPKPLRKFLHIREK
jgi:type IV pilus assembly protein PilY1